MRREETQESQDSQDDKIAEAQSWTGTNKFWCEYTWRDIKITWSNQNPTCPLSLSLSLSPALNKASLRPLLCRHSALKRLSVMSVLTFPLPYSDWQFPLGSLPSPRASGFPAGMHSRKNRPGLLAALGRHPPCLPFIFKWRTSDERQCLREEKKAQKGVCSRRAPDCWKGSRLHLHQPGEPSRSAGPREPDPWEMVQLTPPTFLPVPTSPLGWLCPSNPQPTVAGR